MIGSRIQNFTIAVGGEVFVVHDGGVFRAGVKSLLADEHGIFVGLRIVKPEPNTWEDIRRPMALIYTDPDTACRAAFSRASR